MDIKNGLFEEEGKRLFYKDGELCHAGVVEWDGRIYYIGKGGEAVTGEHIVHREMGNGILERGTYTFGEDGVLIEGSFRAPRESLKKRRTRRHRSRKHGVKKTRRKLIGVLAAVAVVIAAASTAVFWDRRPAPMGETEATITVQLPRFEEEVVLCSASAAAYYHGEMSLREAVADGDPYRPLRFEYDLHGQCGELVLYEQDHPSVRRVLALTADATSVVIDNLKTGTAYEYRVMVGEDVHVGSFRTAEGPRFLSLPGAVNVRDVGGWKTADGKTVRQGMIVRGSELDGLVEPSYYPREEAIEAAMERFGFVYDFDLRASGVHIGEYTSRLDGVPHRFYNAPMYTNAFNGGFRESVRSIFADLADETRYPMYLHCTYGLDRTGTIVYLLLGVLGVPEDTMLQEYRLSCYAFDSYVDNYLIEELRNGLQAYEGTTLNAKIETFLTEEVGVTKEELGRIRAILLE